MRLKPTFAFFGTVFNNVKTLDLTFNTLNVIIDSLPDLNFELVVVDNFSTDGTFEKLAIWKVTLEKKHNVKAVKILKYKCSRGLGRQLALLIARSNYVIPIDFDCVYKKEVFTELIRDILRNNIKCVLLGNEGLYYICYRDIILSTGGYRDLNYGEDTDLQVRLCCELADFVISLPVSVTVNVGHFYSAKSGEKRYSRGFSYLLRLFRNTRDRILVGGYNPPKLIRRYRYIHRMSLRKAIVLALILSSLTVLLQFHPLNTSKIRDRKCDKLKYLDAFTYRDVCMIESLKLTPKALIFKNKPLLTSYSNRILNSKQQAINNKPRMNVSHP